MSPVPAPNAEIARLLRRLVRFRESVAAWRRLGLPMPLRRRRKAALLRQMNRLWTGGYAPTLNGDLVYLPAPLDFQALRLLFDGDSVPDCVLAHLPSGGAALDVGANLGEWTLPLARAAGPAGRVIAIEPNPPIAAALALTLRINNVGQVSIRQCALSDGEGDCAFIPDSRNTGASRLADAASAALTVPVATLDAVAGEAALIRLDLVKIDVEGHERRVLDGGRQTLERFHPALVVESGHETASDRAAIADLLEGLGYTPVAVLLDQGALPFTLADYRAATGPCTGTEARNLWWLPR